MTCERRDISNVVVVSRFCIGDRGNRSTGILDTIARCAIGMVKWCCANCHAGARLKDFSGLEITVFDLRLEDFYFNEEQRRVHGGAVR